MLENLLLVFHLIMLHLQRILILALVGNNFRSNMFRICYLLQKCKHNIFCKKHWDRVIQEKNFKCRKFLVFFNKVKNINCLEGRKFVSLEGQPIQNTRKSELPKFLHCKALIWALSTGLYY